MPALLPEVSLGGKVCSNVLRLQGMHEVAKNGTRKAKKGIHGKQQCLHPSPLPSFLPPPPLAELMPPEMRVQRVLPAKVCAVGRYAPPREIEGTDDATREGGYERFTI